MKQKEEPTIYKHMGSMIKERRRELGISQLDFAAQVSVGYSMYVKIENGQGTRLQTYQEIARHMGVTLTSLVMAAEMALEAGAAQRAA